MSKWHESKSLFEATIYGLKIRVSSNDASVIQKLSTLFPDGNTPQSRLPSRVAKGEPAASYQVHVAAQSRGLNSVSRDGRVIFHTQSSAELLAYLEHAVTIDLAQQLSDHLLAHAGAVARDGQGIVIPATSGAGKSTLAAALVLSGYDYYSDELAIVTSDIRLLPFPKAISLKHGGCKVISGLFPGARLESYGLDEGEEPRQVIVHGSPAWHHSESGSNVSLILLPRYAPDEATSLRSIPKSAAIATLVDQSLNLPLLGKQGIDIISGAVQRADCYALTINGLIEAKRLVDSLLS